MRTLHSLLLATTLLFPLHAAMAQSSGSSGGSAGGSASGAGATSGAAGPANPGVLRDSLDRSNPNPALNQGGSGTSAAPAMPAPPGTNSGGTAQSSGSSANIGAGVTTGTAGRSAGSPGGVDAQGPNKTGDPIRAEDSTLDKKIKSICRGC